MSFLDSLIKDPEYQSHDPRKPEEITEPDIIISPDTRRETGFRRDNHAQRNGRCLNAHGAPPVDLTTWKFEVDGLVEKPLDFSLDEFMQLPVVKVYSDFHCVTRWSRLDNVWTGVPTREIAERAGVKPEAKIRPGARLRLRLDHQRSHRILPERRLALAFLHDGAPIPPEHGGRSA